MGLDRWTRREAFWLPYFILLMHDYIGYSLNVLSIYIRLSDVEAKTK